MAEMVAQAANEHVLNEMLPGYVYCQDYDMYYNHETGYFFDMVRISRRFV